VMAEPGGHHDPDYLASVITARAITTVHFVPSMLSLFLDAPAVRRCTSLRRVICSGEALTPSVNARFHATLGAALHNLYGPTEAAVDVTAWPCADAHADRIPIGYPIENTTMHLLDPHLQPVPPGTPGEAFIGGLAVGRGYWNAPALTAERFVPDPFSATPGARLYRTGDLARLGAEDAIEYLGRLDAQVKLHGVRIEPGEIESVLRAHPAVHECAVVVIDRAGAPALCAYVVEHDGKGKPEEELRAWVSARVPRSMTPSVWIWLDALPLSPSGKLDRRALPPPRPDTPARTPESLLAEIEHLSDEDVEAWLARTATGTASGPGLETAR
jgi:acyl-coenzyme A synthetase/AMP-(fatty) acid ligase